MKTIVLSLIGIISFLGIFAQNGAVLLSADKYSEQVQKEGIVLVDIRTPQEFVQEHIEGAVNINFYDKAFLTNIESSVPKNAQLYIYCRSGNRTGQASKKLVKAGYQNVYDLQGGIISWKSKRLPLTQ